MIFPRGGESESASAKSKYLGLKKSLRENWSVTMGDGTMKAIAPGQSVTLSTGITINFGQAIGQIRI
jgi:hypothetical protein